MTISVAKGPGAHINEQYSSQIAEEIKECRACGSINVMDIFSLGNIKVARFSEYEFKDLGAPLTFCWCPDCTYFQLRHNINPDLVFYDEYGYESGINPIMVNELKCIVKSVKKIIRLKKGDIWLDIASNDATLLLQIEGDIMRVGFDPSRGVTVRGTQKLIEKFGSDKACVFIDYFNKQTWIRKFGKKKAKAITAVAVFYSVQEPNQFLDDVKEVLDPKGIFVVQQNYTPEMVNQLAFCNVVHEHVTYPTFTSFKNLVEHHGFEVVDVTINDINGGSFRTYLKHKGSKLSVKGGKNRIQSLLKKEANKGYLKRDVYIDFARKIVYRGKQVKQYLQKEVMRGKKVYGLAASTRGNTRLQVWGLGPNIIRGIAERNIQKIGKQTLGIPIVSDSEALQNANILFVSIWFYGRKIAEAYKKFLKSGGIMLFPSSPTGEPYLVRMKKGKIIEEMLPPTK